MIAVDTGNWVLSHKCNEPEGDVERNVYFMPLSMETLKIFWEKSRPFKTLFNEEIRGDFHRFCEVFLELDSNGEARTKGLFWHVDDFVGVYYMNDIVINLEATVHFSFFDRRLRGRVGLTKRMLKLVFDTYNFKRLNVTIPVYASVATNFFVEKLLGFKYEGTKRLCVPFGGKLFSLKMYGLLKDELNMEE